MRVTYYFPFGCPYPIAAGCDRVACTHLEYFQARGWRTHCVFNYDLERPSGAALRNKYPGVRVTCLKGVWDTGFSMREQLLTYDRIATGAAWGQIASEPADVFFTNYVYTVPLAHAFPPGVARILESHDLMATSFSFQERSFSGEPNPLPWRARERYTSRIEMDLYQLFDRVIMLSPDEYDAVRPEQQGRAALIRQSVPVPTRPPIPPAQPYDLLFIGSNIVPNRNALGWLYHKLFVPHLRPLGLRLLVVGSVLRDADLPRDDQVVCIPRVDGSLETVYAESKVVLAPLFEGTGMSIKMIEALAMGSTIVTTPIGARGLDDCDAVVRLPDDPDPVLAAATIRELLAQPPRRAQLGSAARAYYEAHFSPEVYARELDRVIAEARQEAEGRVAREGPKR